MSDYYQILGVASDASEAEIKAAYRKLSLELHPDKNKSSGQDTTSQFQQIGEAYDTLKDPQKRKMYDMQKNGNPFGGGHPFGGGNPFGGGDPFQAFHMGAGFPMHPGMHGMPGMQHDVNNIFETLFGGMGGPNIRIFHNGVPVNFKPQPIERKIQISLEQAYTGVTMGLELEREGGKETVLIQIPKGIDTNERIVLSEKGNMSNGTRGDIHLHIEIENHSLFTRKQNDLYCKKVISLKEALCGFMLEIPHLNGKMLRLNNQTNLSVIKPGYQKEIAGYGMTDSGKLIIEFEIQFPESLTSSQVESLREVL